MHHLTRRKWLFLTGACAALRPAVASAVPSATYYRDYSKCLPDHLSALAARAYQARNHELASLRNPQAIAKRQEWARETFWIWLAASRNAPR